MKRLFMGLLLAALLPISAKEPAKRYWLPSWLRRNSLELPTASFMDSELAKKSFICAGVGLSAAFATAAYFVIKAYFPLSAKR